MSGNEMDTSSPTNAAIPPPSERTPHGHVATGVAAVISGNVAGYLLIVVMNGGANLALSPGPDARWDFAVWDNHWVWRTIWSGVATWLGGFLSGMIARKQGRLYGILSALLAALYWATFSLGSWHVPIPGFPGWGSMAIGYRISSTVLAIVTIPLGAAGGAVGAPFGEANGVHFDSRRRSFLGVRWYHFLWLPILMTLLVVQSTWAFMYGFEWFIRMWQVHSLFSFVPLLFLTAMVITMQWSLIGVWRAYEALAGFDDGNARFVWRRVLLYGIGFPLAAAVAQAAVVAAQYGLTRLVAKLSG